MYGLVDSDSCAEHPSFDFLECITDLMQFAGACCRLMQPITFLGAPQPEHNKHTAVGMW